MVNVLYPLRRSNYLDIANSTTILGLLQIIFIDLLLAGDNAIVIGMAARNLPDRLRKKAILWGTVGAIVIRILMALLFVEALDKIPALHLIGGILLFWIGYSLLIKEDKSHDIKAKTNLGGAIMTIVIADGIMGIDNVLGVVGAADGHIDLVIVGMLITVPIIVWGSSLFIKIIDKYPIILYLGGAILGWVGANMIVEDPMIRSTIEPYKLEFGLLCAFLIVLVGWLKNRTTAKL